MRARRLFIIFISMFMGILFATLLLKSNCLAFDVKPYTKIGGMELIEKDISEGHKAFFLLGVDVSKQFVSYEATFTAEGFMMGEAVDEDPELLHNGFRVGAQSKLLNEGSLEPFIAANYEQWNRDANGKYPGSFTSLDFVDVVFGFSFEKEHMYSRIAGIYPVWSSEFNGELGFEAGLGIKLGNVRIGYSYKMIAFSDLTSNFSGAEISFEF